MDIQKIHPLQIGAPQKIHIILIGCGGTGSFTALNLARLSWSCRNTHQIKLCLVDPDRVEEKNIGRQYFCPADVGLNKAETLAKRLSYAFGFEINYLPDWFEGSNLDYHLFRQTDLVLLVGAVDTPEARQTIAKTMANQMETAVNAHSQLWWLDAGNDKVTGQVLLGNSLNPQPQLDKLGYCWALPLPSVREPKLVEPQRPARLDEATLSCADLVAQNVQAHTINYMMAGWLDVFTERLIVARNLTIYGIEINQKTGSARSLPITNGVLSEPTRNKQKARLKVRLEEHDYEVTQVCPLCNGPLVNGEDDNYLDGEIVAIVFCPDCNWRMRSDEYDNYVQAEDEAGLALAIRQLMEGQMALEIFEEAL